MKAIKYEVILKEIKKQRQFEKELLELKERYPLYITVQEVELFLD